MIKIENTDVVGWEAAIRGMRNPMNSWDKGDSYYTDHGTSVGKNDLDLMKRLAKAGTDHRKYLRMIVVYADITAPLYWWKEYDTYKVGTVANSCSTMHKIHDKEFTIDDFSCEHLISEPLTKNEDNSIKTYNLQSNICLSVIITTLNTAREMYIKTKDKKYWWQMIQLLPSSYNQKRTVMLNYEVLANMYHSRKAHKLDEWKEMCKWIESLPYSELITGKADTTMNKSIHIGDVVWDVLTDIKGVVIDEANDKDRVLIYTTEGKIYNFEKDKLIKTGEQIDVLNSVWTRKGEE